MNDTLKSVDSHFAFGKNWAEYAKHINERRINSATCALRDLIPDLSGKRFLDIGCGSGLSSLAALRLGAASVEATDIDADSVKTAEAVLSAHGPRGRWNVQALSVFDLDPQRQGTFDVVHSWGVLHHTGAMDEAIEKAAAMVSKNGLFVVALYHKTPLCWAWTIEKRIYTSCPAAMQKALRGLWIAAFASSLTLTGRSFRNYVETYSNRRGMSFWTDVHDWMGGFPYESISQQQMNATMMRHGFRLEKFKSCGARLGLLGTGCDEYVYARLETSSP